MPQVSDNFGPIYQNVVLDELGNGGISFQAVGSNVRLTNIFFRVETSIRQAVCTIYKGHVADGNRIYISNSGSTGASAVGNVDLFDGETCYVVWTGGDAGATATATITGGKLPLGGVEPSSLEGQEPIAAGDGSLIYPALKSPDFSAGATGWRIGRDGTAEFNNVFVRGEFIVNGANGGYISIVDNEDDVAVINLMPEFPAVGQDSGGIYAFNTVFNPGLPSEKQVATTSITSPRFATWGDASIKVNSQSDDGVFPPSINVVAVDGNVQFLCDRISMSADTDIVQEGSFASASFGTPGIVSSTTPTTLGTTAIADPYGMVGASGIELLKDGTWEAGFAIRFTSQATGAGLRQGKIRVNGTELMQWNISAVNINGTNTTVSGTFTFEGNVGDIVDFQTFQNSGVGLTLVNGSRGWVKWVGRSA